MKPERWVYKAVQLKSEEFRETCCHRIKSEQLEISCDNSLPLSLEVPANLLLV